MPADATHAATTLASELNVASVDVSVPFGKDASTIPVSPVTGLARFPAIGTPLIMPYTLLSLPILLPSTKRAKAFAVATVVRSLTTMLDGALEPMPIALASSTDPRTASTNSTGFFFARPGGSE